MTKDQIIISLMIALQAESQLSRKNIQYAEMDDIVRFTWEQMKDSPEVITFLEKFIKRMEK